MTFLCSLYPSRRVKQLTRPEFPLPALLVCCLVVVEMGDEILAGALLRGGFHKRSHTYNDPVLDKMHI
jgi:hypothetical protein